MSKLLGAFTLLIGLFLVSAQAQVTMEDIERQSLRGLPGAAVIVELLEAEIETAGITAIQIKTDVELRLRKGGIRVLTNDEVKTTLGLPLLVVTVGLSKVSELERHVGTFYTQYLLVELKQFVSLKRDPSITVIGTTWSKSLFGVVGRSKLRGIRDNVADYTDQFINDFLAANPRPRQ